MKYSEMMRYALKGYHVKYTGTNWFRLLADGTWETNPDKIKDGFVLSRENMLREDFAVKLRPIVLNGLEWYPETKYMSWDEAMEYAKFLSDGWRLPTIQELFSIIDFKISPATTLPDTYSSTYWSSTICTVNKSNACTVYFFDGSVYNKAKTGSSYVRCVRNINKEVEDEQS